MIARGKKPKVGGFGGRSGPGAGASAPPSIGLAQMVVDCRSDPDRCRAVIASLMDEYELYVRDQHATCPSCPVVRAGPVIVRSMIEWKAVHGDGHLGHWTYEDVHAYLVDHLPSEVPVDHPLLVAAPTCAGVPPGHRTPE